MKEKKTKLNTPKDFYTCDGSGESFEESNYNNADYLNFLSNGMADNEKIEAVDYFEAFLSEDTSDDKK